jgi:allantoicase
MSHDVDPELIEYFDLASEELGGAVLWANDEFFAEKENLIRAAEPVWKEGVYTDRGKWMDGWETRRRREPGHDRCIVRLGVPGVIRHIVVNTAYFRGNYPESCSIEGCVAPEDTPVEVLLEETQWVNVLAREDLDGDSENRFEVHDRRRFTHLRFHIYPDGGVARLRVYGEVVPDPAGFRGRRADLAAALHGGATLAQSDMFFGLSQNLLKPGRGVNMGDGWETTRRRGPGHDWVSLRLAAEGVVEEVEVDTIHFKGNYPDRCSLELYGAEPEEPEAESASPAFAEHPLQAHTRHTIPVDDASPATHAVFRIYPDGGVSRLRLRGQLTDRGRRMLRLRWLNAMHDDDANEMFRGCCGADAWASEMSARLPFDDPKALYQAADEVWGGLDRDDWLEAFRAHPRIGGRETEHDATEQSRDWSAGEQAGMGEANRDTVSRMERLNDAYYEKHGFIFIIFASGKSADEMLAALEERLENDTETEIDNAAEEQRKITRLRLEKWLSEE